MDEDLAEAMYTSGLSHMTVVSGTHCSLIVGALLGLIRMCLSCPGGAHRC